MQANRPIILKINAIQGVMRMYFTKK